MIEISKERALQIMEDAFKDHYEKADSSDQDEIEQAQKLIEKLVSVCEGCDRVEGSTRSCENIQNFCERCIDLKIEDARNEGYDAGKAEEQKNPSR